MTYEDLTPEERRDLVHDIREFMDAARRLKCQRIEFGPEALRVLVDNNASLIVRIYGDAPLIEEDTTLSDPELAKAMAPHIHAERLSAIDDENA